MVRTLLQAKFPCVVILTLAGVSGLQGAEIPWPAENLSESTNITHIEGPGVNDFHVNLSGAFWNPETRRLWVCRNGGSGGSKLWVLREDGAGSFEVDERDGLRGEWTNFGDLEAITQADYSEEVVYLLIEGQERIKEFDVSIYGTAVLRNNWNTSLHLPLDDGSGAEGLAFVPDSFLSAQGFVDGNGNPYVSQNGMGGLMFVAHQNGGRIYAFDLNRNNASFTFVGAYRTNYSESCELTFDRSDGRFYILHGANWNRIEVATLGSTLVNGERQMNELFTYGRPTGSPNNWNLEGFALLPNDDCVDGKRSAFLTIDDGGAESLLWYKEFPCNCEVLDSDSDGINDCSDDCPGTPSGETVDVNGCACSQLYPAVDSDGDGVIDCFDDCPGTPSGETVDANGCACSQLYPAVDSDGDGVIDCFDDCPGTPSGEAVNANGCACSQLYPAVDSDGDGVIDCFDDCPGTPSGATVDVNGCACSQLYPAVDSDGDGVIDCFDDCPNTPSGESVDLKGCSCLQSNPATDADQDGVPDCLDHCSNTPAGLVVDSNGCHCIQLDPGDDDGDGVPNCYDACPGTPTGTPVSSDGCPLPVSGSGIQTTNVANSPDSQDSDPLTPSGPGSSGSSSCGAGMSPAVMLAPFAFIGFVSRIRRPRRC